VVQYKNKLLKQLCLKIVVKINIRVVVLVLSHLLVRDRILDDELHQPRVVVVIVITE